MIYLTDKERELLLILLKDYSAFHNANMLSKEIGITRIGAIKMLRRLLKENIVISKTIGRAIIFKINLESDYSYRLVAFILAEESTKYARWKNEFKELFSKDRIVLMYGSAIKDYKNAKDIDIMVLMDGKDSSEVDKIIAKKQNHLAKKIHLIKLTHEDFVKSMKKKDKAMVDIIRSGILLFGYESYLEAIKDVTML